MIYAEQVRGLRAMMNISQAQFAAGCKLSEKHIQRIESEKSRISDVCAERIRLWAFQNGYQFVFGGIRKIGQ